MLIVGVRYNKTKYIYLIENPFMLGLTSVEYEDNIDLTIDQFSRFQEAVDYEEEDYEVLAVDKQSKEVTKNPTFQFLHDQKEEIMVVVCMKDFNAADFINEEPFFQKEIRILND